MIRNFLIEMQFEGVDPTIQLYCDNEAMIDFIKGDAVAKGARYMELRYWFTRDIYQRGGIRVDYMTGITLPADKLTKLGTKETHEAFRREILGLGLLD